ncbi:unnamed protein product, partial [marine sediment metagenome]
MPKVKHNVYIFADLVGSTSYKERHSYQIGWSKVKKHCKIVIDEIMRNGGCVFKVVGDGVIGKFEGYDQNVYNNALTTAFSILLLIDRYNERHGLKNEVKSEDKIETKIGIGFGKITSYQYKG